MAAVEAWPGSLCGRNYPAVDSVVDEDHGAIRDTSAGCVPTSVTSTGPATTPIMSSRGTPTTPRLAATDPGREPHEAPRRALRKLCCPERGSIL